MNELSIRARNVVRNDPGIPIGLLIYRLAGDVTPTDEQRRYLYGAVSGLIDSGWLRDVSEGEEGQRPVSRRIYVSVPLCHCGDSLFSGSKCPDEGTQNTWPDTNMLFCPARKRAGIEHE